MHAIALYDFGDQRVEIRMVDVPALRVRDRQTGGNRASSMGGHRDAGDAGFAYWLSRWIQDGLPKCDLSFLLRLIPDFSLADDGRLVIGNFWRSDIGAPLRRRVRARLCRARRCDRCRRRDTSGKNRARA